MVLDNEITLIYALFAAMLVFNFLDFYIMLDSMRRLSVESWVYKMLKLDAELTIAFIIFEISGLYLIILATNGSFSSVFAVTTALFAMSTIAISYIAFSIIKQIENFTNKLEKLQK